MWILTIFIILAIPALGVPASVWYRRHRLDKVRHNAAYPPTDPQLPPTEPSAESKYPWR